MIAKLITFFNSRTFIWVITITLILLGLYCNYELQRNPALLKIFTTPIGM